jgi:hypothetical protein
MSHSALSRAFYRQPGLFPHRLLSKLGLSNFYVNNAVVTAACVLGLSLAAWKDGSLLLHQKGYGYLEHPGIFGWYAIQLLMPAAIFRLVCRAARSKHFVQRVQKPESSFSFNKDIFLPMVDFIGFKTPGSRSYYSLLFLIGFSGFAWNTYQNLLPNVVIPLDFWDSINFFYGYTGTRLYKFYTHALLAPSLIHVFSGIMWVYIVALKRMISRGEIRILPFNVDRCGGFGFVSNLLLTPVVVALLISGLAFFGNAYTHKQIDISTIQGGLAAVAIVLAFYVVPTFFIRSTIMRLKVEEVQRLYRIQERYYQSILSNELQGDQLRDAREYLSYFSDVISRIDRIPNWPHLAKVFGALGFALSPAILAAAFNVAATVLRLSLFPISH